MKSVKFLIGLMLLITLACASNMDFANGISAKTKYSDFTKSFITIDTSLLALENVKLIDGTGKPSKENQTILIKEGQILNINNSVEIKIPKNYLRIDLNGKTIIPGIIGTHNHMRIPQSAMLFTSPKLYLASGVTTIQTCGTGNPYEELEISKAIKKGNQPGPNIVNSGPYLTGPYGKSNFIRCTDEKMIRDTISYWADLGVEWFKVYRNTRPADLKIIVDAAHKNGAKVTGHLCATTYEEAAKIGIDMIEHGFIHSSDHKENRLIDSCSGGIKFRSDLDIDSEEVQNVQKMLIENNVAMGSTLAIFDAIESAKADERDLEMLAGVHHEAYYHRANRKKELGEEWFFKNIWITKSMEYDLRFYRKGGLLVAGPDPGLHNMPGFGDQKNYELLVKGGFKPEEAIQVMTSNGAKVLKLRKVGTIEEGMQADLVVLNGDLESESKIIREVEMVIKNGTIYDPMLLQDAVRGNIGSKHDDLMTYYGQTAPELTPKIFAPEFISKKERNEFGICFSKYGRELYFGIDINGKAEIHKSKLINGVWTNPEPILKDSIFSFNDPMLSNDESRLYFISDKSIDSSMDKKDYDIWYVEQKNNKWSDPVNAGSTINSKMNEYFMSFTEDGSMYFSSNKFAEEGKGYNFEIFSAAKSSDSFAAANKLDSNINTNRYEADVFIAPDESYIIFCGKYRNGFGMGDLYISFKDEQNNWLPSVNMGETINSDKHELCPFVSKDGKYLFYTSNQDIYWVSTDILEQIKDKAGNNR